MKKLLCSLFVSACGFSVFGQTLPNGNMESWRTSTAGSVSPVSIQAPVYWYGADSLIISDGQLFGTFLGIPASSWKRQIFREAVVIHSGLYSAKIMTRNQDTLGIFPGILSNSKANVPVSLTGVGTVTFSGGTAVTLRIDTVSAWVEYFPGKDSLGHTGSDTGIITAQAYAHIGSVDSLVGVGTAQIVPTGSSFVQVFATMAYTDTVDAIDTIRINITSSGGGTATPLDSSTLYVDDITMSGVPQTSHVGVSQIAMPKDLTVYPNPASDQLYFNWDAAGVFDVKLFCVNGQEARRQSMTGSGQMDVSGLAPGLYFYEAAQSSGAVSRGMVSICR